MTISPSLNTRVIWSLMTLFAVVDAIGLKAEGIRLVPHVLLGNVLTVAILFILSVIYTYFRPVARIAEMTHAAAAYLVFAAVSELASYLVLAWHRPLIDDYLVATDHVLGLDWLASYKWVIAHPLIHQLLHVTYSTLIPQVIFLLLFLNFTGRCARSWEMLWLFIVSCTICVVFSGLWPASGAFSYYHVETDRAYVQVFMALHKGTLKVIGNTPLQGIIQFPSFHMALGILLIYVARGMPLLFISLLEINILLFLSTPSIGGHHFADLLGGIALAAVTIFVVRKVFATGLMPETEKITPM